MDDYQKKARIFKAFCDENRLKILQLLSGGEMCACKVQEKLAIGQSTLSHHMRILCDAEVVIPRRDGKWTYYSLSREGGEKAAELLREVLHLND